MGAAPEVSIVIRTKNEAANIGRCLESLLSQDTSHAVEIIVIDSGSTDRTVEICRRFPVRVHEIPPHTFNYGRALNLGAMLAKGHFFVAFTAHALPLDAGWLEKLLVHFDQRSNVAGVFSREIAWPDASPLESARLSLRFPPEGRIFSLEGVSEETRERYLKNVPYSNVASATLRELLLQFPFPEIAYGEDRVWARTMLQHGYCIIYEPSARVYHSHRESLLSYYKRQYHIGQSKREVQGYPPSFLSVSRVAFGDLSQHIHLFRQSLPLHQQLYWILQGVMYASVRIFAQWLGGRGSFSREVS